MFPTSMPLIARAKKSALRIRVGTHRVRVRFVSIKFLDFFSNVKRSYAAHKSVFMLAYTRDRACVVAHGHVCVRVERKYLGEGGPEWGQTGIQAGIIE